MTPRTHVQKSGMVVHASNPWWRQVDTCGLLAGQTSRVKELWVQWEILS